MTSKERALLKKHAQVLKPIFQIGANELQDCNIESILTGFNNRELLKVKVNRVDKSNKVIVREIGTKIEEKTDIQVVDVIGTTIILYKRNENPELNILN